MRYTILPLIFLFCSFLMIDDFKFITPFRFPTISTNKISKITQSKIDLGRRLFYDVNLSQNGKISCASCHQQQLAFTDGEVKSQNVSGETTRNTPTIQNLIWSNKLFFDGRSATLADQAKDALHGEQNINIDNVIKYLENDSIYCLMIYESFGKSTILENEIYESISDFTSILISSDSKFDKFKRGELKLTDSEERGRIIFFSERGDCFRCHSFGNTLLMTDNIFHNNGIDSVVEYNFIDIGRGKITKNKDDYGKFKTPTLRNIELTSPYMHDGRYKTLDEVINFYSDSLKESLTVDPNLFTRHDGFHFSENEKKDIINFLKSLTDSSFINNPAFQNPF